VSSNPASNDASAKSCSELEKIVKWLGATDYWVHHREISKARTPGTGTWFLNRSEYLEWRTSTSGRLYVTAMGA